jgi:hypothetical protein
MRRDAAAPLPVDQQMQVRVDREDAPSFAAEWVMRPTAFGPGKQASADLVGALPVLPG